jgi:hypothetical protein
MNKNGVSFGEITAVSLAAIFLIVALPSISLAADVTSSNLDKSLDIGDSFQKTQDGGFIVVSTKDTKNPDGNDVRLTKTDDKGKEIWAKSYSFGPGEDNGASVLQTKDGGFAVAGYTNAKDATYDVLLMKTDSDGSEQWKKTFSLGSGDDIGGDVKATDDGGFVIAGRTKSKSDGGSDVLLLKANAEGNEQWNKTFSFGSGSDIGVSVLKTKDGSYTLAGYTNTTGSSYDALLMKTDSSGNKLWSKTYSLGACDDTVGDVQEVEDGYVMAGQTGCSDAGGKDALLIKTDSDGNELWRKTFSLGTGNEGASSIQQAIDNGYIISGFTSSTETGSSDIFLLNTDAAGEEIWKKTFSFGLNDDAGSDVLSVDDGYVVAGITATDAGRDIVLVKTDLDGNEKWRSSFTGKE